MNSVFWTPQEWCPYELKDCATRAAKVQFRQDSSTERGKWAQDPTPNQGATYNLTPIDKGFLQWRLTRYISHTSGKGPMPKSSCLTHTHTSIFVCFIVCGLSVPLCFVLTFLISFSFNSHVKRWRPGYVYKLIIKIILIKFLLMEIIIWNIF